MKEVSMLELRKNAHSIIEKVEKGQPFVLTYRGRPVARLQPLEDEPRGDDPIYSLAGMADSKGKSLTNMEIDQELYGQ